MTKPSFNASNEELRGQVDRGAVGPTSKNVGGGSGGARPPSGGSTSTIKGIPSRTGAYNPVAGSYMNTAGAPSGGTNAVKPGSVPVSNLGGASNAKLAMLAHGRTLGAVAHLRSVHGDHPHLQMAHAKATAGIASYKNSAKKQGMSGGPSFGSIGGSSSSGNVGAGVPGAGMAAPGAAPLGMGALPDEL